MTTFQLCRAMMLMAGADAIAIAKFDYVNGLIDLAGLESAVECALRA